MKSKEWKMLSDKLEHAGDKMAEPDYPGGESSREQQTVAMLLYSLSVVAAAMETETLEIEN